MADADDRNVLVQVCMECGKQYIFDARSENASPDDLVCEKCGGVVFRSFTASTRPGEAEADFREATERDTAPDDPATDVLRGDLQDLGNL